MSGTGYTVRQEADGSLTIADKPFGTGFTLKEAFWLARVVAGWDIPQADGSLRPSMKRGTGR